MSHLDSAEMVRAEIGRKEDPYQVASEYFREQETLKSEPGLYYLHEILALKNRTPDDLRQIHQAKLAYPGLRVVQEAPEAIPSADRLKAPSRDLQSDLREQT